MKTKLINDGPQKTYVLVLDKGDEAVSSIEDFARKNGIAAAQLTGIGAFSDDIDIARFPGQMPDGGPGYPIVINDQRIHAIKITNLID